MKTKDNNDNKFFVQEILDVTLSTIITKQIFSVIKSSDKISVNQVIKLFAIMSLNEVRKAIMLIIQKIIGFISDNYSNVLEYLNKYVLHNFIFTFIVKLIRSILDKFKRSVENPVNSTSIQLTYNLPFMQALVQHVKLNGKYEVLPSKNITIKNKEKILYNEVWTNISIGFENTLINVENLNLAFEEVKTTKNLIHVNSLKNGNNTIKFNVFSNMISTRDLAPTFISFVKYINSLK